VKSSIGILVASALCVVCGAPRPVRGQPMPPNPSVQASGPTGADIKADLDDETPVEPRNVPQVNNTVKEAYTPQPGGLTADQVAARAVATSDSIAAKNAQLRAAAAEVDSALYGFFPKATLNASYTRLSRVNVGLGDGYSVGAGAPGPLTVGPNGEVQDSAGNPVGAASFSFPAIVNNYSLSASLSVPLSDYVLRLSNSIAATKRNREASELNAKAERQKVQGDARIAFFNWARSIGQVAVTEKSIERVRARLKDAHAAFTVGNVTRAEVLRLEAQVATTEAGLESARAFRELAAQQLAVIMDDQQSNYRLGEDVLAETVPPPRRSLGELVADAQRQRFELMALDRSVESLRRGERVIRAGRLPRLDGFADYTYANPNQRYFFDPTWHGTWSAGVQLSWTINDVLVNGKSGDQMAAQRAELEANRKALAKGIRMEVTSAYTDARRAAAALEAAKRAAEASQAAYDTSVQLYRVGKATTAELIDAEADLVSSLLGLINAHIDTRVAATKLARATGRDLTHLGY